MRKSCAERCGVVRPGSTNCAPISANTATSFSSATAYSKPTCRNIWRRPANAARARVMLSGEIKTAVTVKGIGVTKGARAAIEAAGGTVETA